MTKKHNIILVVDDDLAVGESLKFALEVEGFVVRLCGSGAELFVHPDLREAACIILDYRMPFMDGLSVLEHLATEHVRTPAILITAHATAALRRRASEAGVRHVLEKPLFNGGLLDSIRDVIAAPRSELDHAL